MNDLTSVQRIGVGHVTGSELVFGAHKLIQTPNGARATALMAGQRPTPRLRTMPLRHRPVLQDEVFGREVELSLAASASADTPLEIYGPDGVGKTVLLKRVAHGRVQPPDGVIFANARGLTVEEILADLYWASWECDSAFLPTPTQLPGFLAERKALVVLDDCELERGELEGLLNLVPRVTFVIASDRRTLWSAGAAEQLGALGEDAAISLIERHLGGFGGPHDRAAAAVVAQRLMGHPQRLVETAALVSGGLVALDELADGGASLLSELNAASLTQDERRILAVLGAFEGAMIGARHIAAVSAVQGAERHLPALERRGWVKRDGDRYRLARTPPTEEGELAARLGAGLVEHLIRFAQEQRHAPTVAAEAEAIERAIAFAAVRDRWPQVLALALASEGKLAAAGAWVKWRRVLVRGLEAARLAGDRSSEAHMLHQLGTLALCLGAIDQAGAQLDEALSIRQRIADAEGAALTRQNLGELGQNGLRAAARRRPDSQRAFGTTQLIVLTVLIAALILIVILIERSS